MTTSLLIINCLGCNCGLIDYWLFAHKTREWWGYCSCIYPSFVYVSLKGIGVVGLDTYTSYTRGIKDFHKCWSGSLAKRRLCLGPAGVINCTPLSALSLWVSLFPGECGYNSTMSKSESPALAGRLFTAELPEKPMCAYVCISNCMCLCVSVCVYVCMYVCWELVLSCVPAPKKIRMKLVLQSPVYRESSFPSLLKPGATPPLRTWPPHLTLSFRLPFEVELSPSFPSALPTETGTHCCFKGLLGCSGQAEGNDKWLGVGGVQSFRDSQSSHYSPDPRSMVPDSPVGGSGRMLPRRPSKAHSPLQSPKDPHSQMDHLPHNPQASCSPRGWVWRLSARHNWHLPRSSDSRLQTSAFSARWGAILIQGSCAPMKVWASGRQEKLRDKTF